MRLAGTYMICPWLGVVATRRVFTGIAVSGVWTATAEGIPLTGRDPRGPTFAIAHLQDIVSRDPRGVES